MRKVHHITTNMRGFQNWMKRNPRKRTDGYFSFAGRELNHEEVKKVVDYAVEKGYRSDADIPGEEVAQILNWDENIEKNFEK